MVACNFDDSELSVKKRRVGGAKDIYETSASGKSNSIIIHFHFHCTHYKYFYSTRILRFFFTTLASAL